MVANLEFAVVTVQLQLQNRIEHRFEQRTAQMDLEMQGAKRWLTHLWISLTLLLYPIFNSREFRYLSFDLSLFFNREI